MNQNRWQEGYHPKNLNTPKKTASQINPLIRKNKKPMNPIRFSHRIIFSFCSVIGGLCLLESVPSPKGEGVRG